MRQRLARAGPLIRIKAQQRLQECGQVSGLQGATFMELREFGTSVGMHSQAVAGDGQLQGVRTRTPPAWRQRCRCQPSAARVTACRAAGGTARRGCRRTPPQLGCAPARGEVRARQAPVPTPGGLRHSPCSCPPPPHPRPARWRRLQCRQRGLSRLRPQTACTPGPTYPTPVLQGGAAQPGQVAVGTFVRQLLACPGFVCIMPQTYGS